MALTFTRYDRQHYAVQYVSGNQADVLSYLQGIYGTTNCYLSGNTIINPQEALNLNDWLVQKEGVLYDGFTNTDFQQWYELPTDQTAIGIATIPSIAAGGNANIAVTLKPGFADTLYLAVATIIGSVTILGQLSVSSTTKTSGSVVTVNITNGALVTVAGGQVLVNAVHN